MKWCKQLLVITDRKTEIRFHETWDLVRSFFTYYGAEDEAENQLSKEVDVSCEGGHSNPQTCRIKKFGQCS